MQITLGNSAGFTAAIVCSLVPLMLLGQPVKRIPLAPVQAQLDADFVGVTSVRELADGRVIITDGRDQQLYIADFKTNSASLLGRKGKGPAEWLRVGFVHALAGDTTILDDWGNMRWMLFHGAKFIGIMPPDHPGVVATRTTFSDVDQFGHMTSTRNPPRRAGRTEFTRADSNTLVFIDRNSGKMDTITRLRERPHRLDVTMNADGRAIGVVPSATEPNAQAEMAKLFFDGWLAVVRLEPLRVDWRSPIGQWTYGKPFPINPEPVNAQERKAIEKRRAESRAEYKKMGLPAPEYATIPGTLPVMSLGGALRASSDGRLLMKRSTSAATPNVRYLVVNRRGGIDGEIMVGAKEEVIGFGARSIYISSKDDDDLQRLRRHPWPN